MPQQQYECTLPMHVCYTKRFIHVSLIPSKGLQMDCSLLTGTVWDV
jgi:hypothetical protein